MRVERTLDSRPLGIGLFAHMHVRGKAMSFIAHTPDGKTETIADDPELQFRVADPLPLGAGQEGAAEGNED